MWVSDGERRKRFWLMLRPENLATCFTYLVEARRTKSVPKGQRRQPTALYGGRLLLSAYYNYSIRGKRTLESENTNPATLAHT